MRFTAAATAAASALELVKRDVPLPMIWMPFTVMPDTAVLFVPENVTVALGIGGVVVMTGNTPAAELGPRIVTVLPDEVAL